MPIAVALLVAAMAAAVTAGLAVLVRAAGGPPAPEEVAERAGLRELVRRRLRPLTVTGLAVAGALVAILAALAMFGLMAVLASRSRLWEVDAAAAAWGIEHATHASTIFLGAVTALGDTATVTLLSGLAVAVEAARRRLGQRWRDATLFVVAVVAGQFAIVNLLKLLFQRVRPPVGEMPDWLANAPAIADAGGFAFPSGHTAATSATLAALALLFGRGRSRPVRVGLAAAAVGLAAAVATSRVLLGVHWVSDVIGGAAIGGLWFAVCALAFGGRRLRLGAPLEPATAPAPATAAPREAGPPGPRDARAQEETQMSERNPESTPEPEPEPSMEQIESRAASLAGESGERETGNRPRDPEAQAGALLQESEERVEDPAARDPDDPRVIRRGADEGVPPP